MGAAGGDAKEEVMAVPNPKCCKESKRGVAPPSDSVVSRSPLTYKDQDDPS